MTMTMRNNSFCFKLQLLLCTFGITSKVFGITENLILNLRCFQFNLFNLLIQNLLLDLLLLSTKVI